MLLRRVAKEYVEGSVCEEISCEISECCDACDSWHVCYRGFAQKKRQLMQYADKGQTFNTLHGFAPGSENAKQVESAVAFPLKQGEHLVAM